MMSGMEMWEAMNAYRKANGLPYETRPWEQIDSAVADAWNNLAREAVDYALRNTR